MRTSQRKTPIQQLIQRSAEKPAVQKKGSPMAIALSVVGACLIVSFSFWVALSSQPIAVALSRAFEGLSF